MAIVWVLLWFNSNYKAIYNKIRCRDGYINCRPPSKFLHTFNIETSITLATCTHSRNLSLWQHTPWVIQTSYILPICLGPSIWCRMCSSQFSHQIKSEYFGGNISVYVEVISLDHFSSTYQVTSSAYFQSLKLHALFYYFL